MTETTLDLVDYYGNLLIIQYKGLPKAEATVEMMAAMGIMPQYPSVQTISFDIQPLSGQMVLAWEGVSSAAINWDDSTATIQSKLRAITGLGSITVVGLITDPVQPQLVVSMLGVMPVPAPLITLVSSTLEGSVPSGALATEGGDIIVTESGDTITTDTSSADVTVTIDETDLTLPLAVMNGYNLIGPNPAVGVQLDVLGKYAGVSRNGFGFNGQPITLSDSDFLKLINMAVIKNNGGSSLATIVTLLHQNFPGQILVFDYTNMRISYIISSTLSMDLIQLFVTEGLLPKPMAVELASIVIVPDITDLFGFGGYTIPVPPANRSPYNTYSDYRMNRPFLSYADGI